MTRNISKNINNFVRLNILDISLKNYIKLMRIFNKKDKKLSKSKRY